MKIINRKTIFERINKDFVRIPTLIKAANGDILAFGEYRNGSHHDAEDIDIVFRRINNNDVSPMQTVVKGNGNTCGNQCCVLEKATGKIHMVYNWNPHYQVESFDELKKNYRKAYYTYSCDNGNTWAEPIEITDQIKEENWHWHALGPCHGIECMDGTIVFPCNYSLIEKPKEPYSFAVYSNDGCKSFKYGAVVAPKTNECCISQLNDGKLFITMRSTNKEKRRYRAYSDDMGKTWYDYEKDNTLCDPICQGSSIYSVKYNKLYLTHINNETERKNLVLRCSSDNGKSWEKTIVLFEGKAAYSDLVFINDDEIGCLFECCEETSIYRIDYVRVKI